uniref:Uncharacterized protein n=1 Tax=Timema monikensis TaxID=170555 RepID=A0A7R9EBY1_9NEOP|nr:unnamed protein product [Timema monikensis]
MGYKYGYKVLINTMMVSILCRKGTSFHESRGNTYSPPYGEGDVLGFLIILPESENISPIPPTYKDRPLVKFKSHLYYEEKDNVAEALKNLNVLPGSKIIFFTNGQCHGAAFSDIYGGAYYPTLSLYKNATNKKNRDPSSRVSVLPPHLLGPSNPPSQVSAYACSDLYRSCDGTQLNINIYEKSEELYRAEVFIRNTNVRKFHFNKAVALIAIRFLEGKSKVVEKRTSAEIKLLTNILTLTFLITFDDREIRVQILFRCDASRCKNLISSSTVGKLTFVPWLVSNLCRVSPSNFRNNNENKRGP